jgi:hypothetical protein
MVLMVPIFLPVVNYYRDRRAVDEGKGYRGRAAKHLINLYTVDRRFLETTIQVILYICCASN